MGPGIAADKIHRMDSGEETYWKHTSFSDTITETGILQGLWLSTMERMLERGWIETEMSVYNAGSEITINIYKPTITKKAWTIFGKEPGGNWLDPAIIREHYNK